MVKKCLLFHIFFIFPQCGDNDTSVATFVATLVITWDTTAVDHHSDELRSRDNRIGPSFLSKPLDYNLKERPRPMF